MKNYSVKFELEYWSHAVCEQDAINRSIAKVIDDLKHNGGLETISNITVEEIDEDGNPI